MNINRENYETIMVDYLDGKLSPEDEADLMLFLFKNSDIAEEVEGLNDVILKPTPTSFPNKLNLKKHQYNDLGVDNEIEYLCIAELEGDITSAELSKLKKLSENDDNIRHIKTLFSNTKLAVPHKIVYPYKSNLKRLLIIPIRRSTLRVVISAAASVAIMLGVYATLDLKKPFETIANNEPKEIQSKPTSTENNSIEKKLSLSGLNNPSIKVDVKSNTDKSSSKNIYQKTLTTSEKQNLEAIVALPAKLNIIAQVSPSKLNLPLQISTINNTEKEALPKNSGTYGNTKEYSIAEIAQQGLKKVANSLGVEFEVTKNESGKLKKLSIESNLLAFSTTKNKNDD